MVVDEENYKEEQQVGPCVQQSVLDPNRVLGVKIDNKLSEWSHKDENPHDSVDNCFLLGLFVEYAHDGFFSSYIGNKGNSVGINDKIFSAIYVKVSINRPYVGTIGAALDMSGHYFAVSMPDVGHCADGFGHRVLGNREARLERGLFTSTAHLGM